MGKSKNIAIELEKTETIDFYTDDGTRQESKAKTGYSNNTVILVIKDN